MEPTYAFQVQYADIDLSVKDQNVYACPYIFSTALEALLHFYLTFVLKKAPQDAINFVKVKGPDGYFFYHTAVDYAVSAESRAKRVPLKYSDINILIFRVDDVARRVWMVDENIEVPVEGVHSVPFASQNFQSLSHDVLRGSLLSDNEIFAIFGNCQYATYLSRKSGDALEKLGFVEDVIRMVASEELRISNLLISPFLYSTMNDFSSRSDDCFRSAVLSYQPAMSKLDSYFLRQAFSNMIFHNVPVQFSSERNAVFFLYNHRFVMLFEVLKELAASSEVPSISPYTTATFTEDGVSIDSVDFTWDMMSNVYFHVLQYFAAFLSEQESLLYFRTAVHPYSFVPLINDHGKLSALLFSKTDIDHYTVALEAMNNLQLARFERNLTLRASYYTRELAVSRIANTSAVALFDNVTYVPLESDVEDASVVTYEGLLDHVVQFKERRTGIPVIFRAGTSTELEVALLCWLYYQRFVVLPAGTVCYTIQEGFLRSAPLERFTAYFSLLDALYIAHRQPDPEKWLEVREVRFAKSIVLLDFTFCENPFAIVHAFTTIGFSFNSILKDVYPFVTGYVGEERRSFVLTNPSTFATPTFTTAETNADHETFRSILYKQQSSFKTTVEDGIPPLSEYSPNVDVLKNVNLRSIAWENFEKPTAWHNKLDAFYWIHGNSSPNFIDVILTRIFGVNDVHDVISEKVMVKSNLVISTETLLVYMKPASEDIQLIPGAWRIRRFNTTHFFNPVVGMTKRHYAEFVSDAEVHVSHYASLSTFEMGQLLGLEGDLINLRDMNPTILTEPEFEPSTKPMLMSEADMESYRFVPDYKDVTAEEFAEADRAVSEAMVIRSLDHVEDIPEDIPPSVLTPSVVQEILPPVEESSDDALLKEALKKIYSPRDHTYELTFAVGKGVSGELQRLSVQRILDRIELDESSVMGDIGAGRGNILFHAFLSKKCTGYGWELDDQQFQLYEANRASIKHLLRGLNPELMAKLPRVYHQKVEGEGVNALTHFADITHFYSFDTAMPESTYIDIERLLNRQRTWRYFCSTTKTYNYENLINAVIVDQFAIHTRGGKGQHQVWIFKRETPPPLLTPAEAIVSPLLPQLMSAERPLPVVINGTLDFSIGDKTIKKNDVLESILNDFMLQTSLVLYRACVGADDFYIGMNEDDLFMVARVPSHAPHTAVALMSQDDAVTTVRFDAALFAENILPQLSILQASVLMDAPLKWAIMVESASELAREHHLLKDDEVIIICGTIPTTITVPEKIILPENNNLENNNNNMNYKDSDWVKRRSLIHQGLHENIALRTVDYIRTYFLNTTKPIYIRYDVKHKNKGNLNHIEFVEPIAESILTLARAAPFSDAKKKTYSAVVLTGVKDSYNNQGQLASLEFTVSGASAPVVFRESKKDHGLLADIHIQFSSLKMALLAEAVTAWFADAFAPLINVPVTLDNEEMYSTWIIESEQGEMGIFTGEDVVNSNITPFKEEDYKRLKKMPTKIIKMEAGVFTDEDMPVLDESVPDWKKKERKFDPLVDMKIMITLSNGVKLTLPTNALYFKTVLLNSSLQVARRMDNYADVLAVKEQASDDVTETELQAASEKKGEQEALEYTLQSATKSLTVNHVNIHLANVFYNRPSVLRFERREEYHGKVKTVRYVMFLMTEAMNPNHSSGIELPNVALPSEGVQKTYRNIQVSKVFFEIATSFGRTEVVFVIEAAGMPRLVIRPKKNPTDLSICFPHIYYTGEVARRFRNVLNANLKKVLNDDIAGKHVLLRIQSPNFYDVSTHSRSSFTINVEDSNAYVNFKGISTYDDQWKVPEIKDRQVVVVTGMHVAEKTGGENVGNDFVLILTLLNHDRPLIFELPYSGDYEFVSDDHEVYSLMIYDPELDDGDEDEQSSLPSLSSSSESSDHDQDDIIMNDDINNNNNKSVENYPSIINTDEKEDVIMEKEKEEEGENILKETNESLRRSTIMDMMSSDESKIDLFMRQVRFFFINTIRPIIAKFDVKIKGEGSLTHFVFTEPISNSSFTLDHVAGMPAPKKELYQQVFITEVVPQIKEGESKYEEDHLLSLTFVVTNADKEPLPNLMIKPSKPEEYIHFNSEFRVSKNRVKLLLTARNKWISEHFPLKGHTVSVRVDGEMLRVEDMVTGDNLFFHGIQSVIRGFEGFPVTEFYYLTNHTYVKNGIMEEMFFSLRKKGDKKVTSLNISFAKKEEELVPQELILDFYQSGVKAIVLNARGKLVANIADAYDEVMSVPDVFVGTTKAEKELIKERDEAKKAIQSTLTKLQELLDYERVHLSNVFLNHPINLTASVKEMEMKIDNRTKKIIETSLALVVAEATSHSNHSGIYLNNNRPLTETQQRTFGSTPIVISSFSFVQQEKEIVAVLETSVGRLVIRPKEKQTLSIQSLKIFYTKKEATMYLRSIAGNLHLLRSIFVGQPVKLLTSYIKRPTHKDNEIHWGDHTLNILREDVKQTLVFAHTVRYEQVYKEEPVNADKFVVISSMALEFHPSLTKLFNLVLTLEGTNTPLVFPLHFHGTVLFTSPESPLPINLQLSESAEAIHRILNVTGIEPPSDNTIFKEVEEDVEMEPLSTENFLTESDMARIDELFPPLKIEDEASYAARKATLLNFVNAALRLWMTYSEDKDDAEKLRYFKELRYHFFYDKTNEIMAEKFVVEMYKKFKGLISFSLPNIHVETKKELSDDEEEEEKKNEKVYYLTEEQQKLVLRHVNHEFSSEYGFVGTLRHNAFDWTEEDAHISAVRFLVEEMEKALKLMESDPRYYSGKKSVWRTESVQYKSSSGAQAITHEQVRVELAHIQNRLQRKTIGRTLEIMEKEQEKALSVEKSSKDSTADAATEEVDAEAETLELSVPSEPLKDYTADFLEKWSGNNFEKKVKEFFAGMDQSAQENRFVLDEWFVQITRYVNIAMTMNMQVFPEELSNAYLIQQKMESVTNYILQRLQNQNTYHYFVARFNAYFPLVQSYIENQGTQTLHRQATESDESFNVRKAQLQEFGAYHLRAWLLNKIYSRNLIPELPTSTPSDVQIAVGKMIEEMNFFIDRGMTPEKVTEKENTVVKQQKKDVSTKKKNILKEISKHSEPNVDEMLQTVAGNLKRRWAEKQKQETKKKTLKNIDEASFSSTFKTFVNSLSSSDLNNFSITPENILQTLSLKIAIFLKNEVANTNGQQQMMYAEKSGDEKVELDEALIESISSLWAKTMLLYLSKVRRVVLPDAALYQTLDESFFHKQQSKRRAFLMEEEWVNDSYRALLNIYWMYDLMYKMYLSIDSTNKRIPKLYYETVPIPSYLCDMSHEEMLFFTLRAWDAASGDTTNFYEFNDIIRKFKKILENNKDSYLLKLNLLDFAEHSYDPAFVLAYLVVYHLNQSYPSFFSKHFNASYINSDYVLGSKKNRDMPTTAFSSRSEREKNYNPYRNIYHQIQDIIDCILKNVSTLEHGWTMDAIDDDAERNAFKETEETRWIDYVYFIIMHKRKETKMRRKRLCEEFGVVALGFENDSGICAIIAVFAQLFYIAPLRQATLSFKTYLEMYEHALMRPVQSDEEREKEKLMVDLRNLFRHIVDSRESCEIMPQIEHLTERCVIHADMSGNYTDEILRCILQLELPKLRPLINLPTIFLQLYREHSFKEDVIEQKVSFNRVSAADARNAAIVIVKYGYYDYHRLPEHGFGRVPTIYMESKAFDLYSITLTEQHVKEEDLPRRLATIKAGGAVPNRSHALCAIRGKWNYRSDHLTWRIFNNSSSYNITDDELNKRTSGKYIDVPEYKHLYPIISFPNYLIYIERSLYASFDWRFLNTPSF